MTARTGAIARVCIATAVPHLDRPFDYLIPGALSDVIEVGTRVRVRFAGRLVNGVVTELADSTDFEGRLTPLKSAAAMPSFTPQAIETARAVARRYGGSLWDVLRLMAPPRVASVEKREWGEIAPDLERYAAAAAESVPAGLDVGLPEWQPGAAMRLVWEGVPDGSAPSSVPARALLGPALTVAAGGQTAVMVVPDARSVAVLEKDLNELGLRRWTARSGGDYSVLDHDHGPSPRYGSYLAGMRGDVRLVIGTRPAALQPVPDLGLIVVWDDGSNAYEDPHAPYPHARTVAAMRVDTEGAGLLIGGYSTSVDAIALVEHGWATLARPERSVVRAITPSVDVLSEERRDAQGAAGWHWMPGSVWADVTAAVSRGPVAIMVPVAGYVLALACAQCRAWSECRDCGGTLRQASASEQPACTVCKRVQESWHCSECHSTSLKQVRQGVERIAEQLKAMSRGWPVHVSTGAAGPLADLSVEEGLVVATPGALPAVKGGYTYGVVVGAQVHGRAPLGAELAALRWWLNVAAMVRSRQEGGAVTVVGVVPDAVRLGLTGWTPADAAMDAYRERAELGLPPVRRVVTVSGEGPDVSKVLDTEVDGVSLQRRPDVTVVFTGVGATLIVARAIAGPVVDAVRAVQQEGSRAGSGELRLRVDGPLELPY